MRTTPENCCAAARLSTVVPRLGPCKRATRRTGRVVIPKGRLKILKRRSTIVHVNSRRPIAAAVLAAAVLCCSDSSGPSGLVLKNAGTLATQLEGIDRAMATAPLRGLSGLADPVKFVGIDVHNMSPSVVGRTMEWGPLYGQLGFTDRAGAPPDALRLILYTTDSTFRPAYPLHEIGYADLYPHNTFNGGGPDSMNRWCRESGGAHRAGRP